MSQTDNKSSLTPTDRFLRTQLLAYLGVCAIIAIVYETGLLTEGALVTDTMTGTQMLAQMWMTVFALVGIPLALKLFHLKYVNDRLTGDESRADIALRRWGTLRLALIGLPMVADILCYYLFGADVRFFYLAVIEALALCFANSRPQKKDNQTNE